MASQYIIFENQQLLWKAIQSSPLFGTANLGAVSKYDWFKSIIHRFYRQLVDSNVKSLSRPALQELNKRTISYMIADMKSRVTNDKMYKPPPLLWFFQNRRRLCVKVVSAQNLWINIFLIDNKNIVIIYNHRHLKSISE